MRFTFLGSAQFWDSVQLYEFLCYITCDYHGSLSQTFLYENSSTKNGYTAKVMTDGYK